MAPTLPYSKFSKHEILSRCDALKPYLPATDRFVRSELSAWLDGHGAVVIKPEWGEGGRYVCKVSHDERGYSLHTDSRLTHTTSFERLLELLPVWTKTKRCIVQRLVHLQTFRGRPVDIRTIVQRNEKGVFEVTGSFIKIAPKSRFVTNVKQGGTIQKTDLYLLRSISGQAKRASVRDQLYGVSELIGQCLGEQFSNFVYGIDLGLDENGQIWIIEVNTQPNLGILGEIDTRMRRRALSLRQYNQRRQRAR
ncbi:MAG: YheC/YheD family protein [Firmicutes bacterium]|nr:YheC/YheD family protein [Bacillota bacterium]